MPNESEKHPNEEYGKRAASRLREAYDLLNSARFRAGQIDINGATEIAILIGDAVCAAGFAIADSIQAAQRAFQQEADRQRRHTR